MRSPRSHAQRSVACALPDVQTVPPRSPSKALMEAAEVI
jgi:hypothetical protein